jgi:hypothetical protein
LNPVSALRYFLVFFHVSYLKLSLHVELESLYQIFFNAACWSLCGGIFGLIFSWGPIGLFGFLLTGRGFFAFQSSTLLRKILLVIVELGLNLVLNVIKVQLVVSLLVWVLRYFDIYFVAQMHLYRDVYYGLKFRLVVRFLSHVH